MIAEALEAIGGVPAKILADRMGCLKGGVVANVIVPTPDYVRFASHYGFVPDFCHGADPQSKGIVENLCGYAQDDLAVPLLTEAALTGEVVDLRALNGQAAAWCAEVNAAVHSEICAVPDQRLVEERTVFKALPSLRLEIGAGRCAARSTACPVSVTALLATRSHALVGATVAVVVDHGALIIWSQRPERSSPSTNSSVRVRPPSSMSTTTALDRPHRVVHDRKPKRRNSSAASALEAEQFLVGAAAIGNTRLKSELDTLLGLGLLTVNRRWLTPCAGRWRFDDSAPPTCAPSSMPAPEPPNPARPGTPWSSICPPPKPGPWMRTRSAAGPPMARAS